VFSVGITVTLLGLLDWLGVGRHCVLWLRCLLSLCRVTRCLLSAVLRPAAAAAAARSIFLFTSISIFHTDIYHWASSAAADALLLLLHAHAHAQSSSLHNLYLYLYTDIYHWITYRVRKYIAIAAMAIARLLLLLPDFYQNLRLSFRFLPATRGTKTAKHVWPWPWHRMHHISMHMSL
jgi:hypothetical protein